MPPKNQPSHANYMGENDNPEYNGCCTTILDKENPTDFGN